MSNLAAAKAAFEAVWEEFQYTNILRMSYILKKGFPGAKSPWIEYFNRCEVLVGGKVRDNRWEEAGKLLGRKTVKVLGEKKPQWDEEIPDQLWTAGNGQYTSFAIATIIRSGIGATYSEYPAVHRLANKVDTDDSVLVIDSRHLSAFKIAEGETIARWKNNSGKIFMKSTKR